MPEWVKRLIPEGWTATELIWLSIGLFLVTFIGSIIAVGWAIVRIPADYFIGDKAPLAWRHRHPVIRWPLIIFKNILGIGLVCLGIIMSLPGVPGQGLLTVLIGAMLLDFPGKRKCERWLLSRRGVLTTLNKLRARYGQEPIRLEDTPPDNPKPPDPGSVTSSSPG